jgi:Bacterial Ig domain
MKRLVALIFAVAFLAVHPAAADDLVTVPNLKGMKGGNDIVGILSTLALNAKFGDPILAPNRDVELTVVDTVPHAGTKVPKGSTVLITAYSHYAPVVVGLQLDKATAKLEAEGVPLAGIDVVNAPSPELVNQVIYQGVPDEAGKLTLKVYAPYYQGNEPQTSTAAPSTPPSAGGGGGAVAGSSGCLRPAAGTVITTSVDTPCSVDLAATLGLPPAMFSDLGLETQPSHGSASWSNGTLTYTPAPGYRGPDSVTMSATAKTAVNGQSVTIGRQNQVWKILVQ